MDEELQKLLVQEEGWEDTPYRDHKGNWTVGVGHLMSRPLSPDAIMQILRDDIQTARDDLDDHFPGWVKLGHNRQMVLLSMMFQLGKPSFTKFVKFWAAVDLEDWETARAEMLDSKWAREDTPERAERLSGMILKED